MALLCGINVHEFIHNINTIRAPVSACGSALLDAPVHAPDHLLPKSRPASPLSGKGDDNATRFHSK